MDHVPISSSQTPEKGSQFPETGGDPASVLARRRLLIKGLGKGGAAIAVMVPIQTLAANTIIGGTKLCTVSGVQSGVGSKPLGVITTCSGFTPTHWRTLSNWPNYRSAANSATNTVGTTNFTQNATFAAVFGSGSANSLMALVTNSPTSDEAAWVTALLNAIQNTKTPGKNFPYSATQVRDYYVAGGTVRINALAFFKGYMQTVN